MADTPVPAFLADPKTETPRERLRNKLRHKRQARTGGHQLHQANEILSAMGVPTAKTLRGAQKQMRKAAPQVRRTSSADSTAVNPEYQLQQPIPTELREAPAVRPVLEME